MEIVTTSRSHGQLKTPCGVDWSIMVAAVYYETKNICLMKFAFVMFLLLNKRVPTLGSAIEISTLGWGAIDLGTKSTILGELYAKI